MEKKHLDIFQYNYGKKYQNIEFLTELYETDWDKIGDFNIEFMTKCCEFLQIKTKLVRASELNVQGKKSHLVLEICKELGADTLLANRGSEGYLNKDKNIFDIENVAISYHDYKPLEYNQHGELFLKDLSVLDLLFSENENSKNFI